MTEIATGRGAVVDLTKKGLTRGAAVKLLGSIVVGAAILAACSDSGSPPARESAVIDRKTAGLEHIQSMDAYVDGAALHALIAGNRPGQRAPEVVYLRSEDGGSSWSPAITLSGTAAGTVTGRRGNDVQVAAAGDRLVAAWRVEGAFPGTGRIATAFSDDGGRTWHLGPHPAAEGNALDQGYMDLAADRLGHFHLVWLDDREETGRYQGLRHARSSDGGRHWSGHQTIDAATCACCWTTLASTPNGVVYALYRDVDPHDMALARLADGAESWRRLGPVGRFDWEFTGCPSAGGGLAVSGEAGATILNSVVWTGAERAPGLYHLRSADGGRTWSAPFPLGDGHAVHSDVAALDRDHIAAVWEAVAPRATTIFMAQSADGGRTWSNPQPLSSAGLHANHPRVLATRFGFRVFWTAKYDDGATRWATAALKDSVLEEASPLAAAARLKHRQENAFPPPSSVGGTGVETGSGRLMLAHAILVKSEPEQGASVPKPPEKIELWFNEGVGRDYMALAVIDSTGARVDDANARLGFFDTSYLRVTLPPVIPGTYTVRYRVQSVDGHIVSGKFNFAVQGQ